MSSIGPLKSFRELTEEDKISRIKEFSDKIAEDAVNGLTEFEEIERILKEENWSLPVKKKSVRRGGANQKKTSFVSINVNRETDKLLSEVSRETFRSSSLTPPSSGISRVNGSSGLIETVC